MTSVEDGSLAGPGLSAMETLITFFVIPTAMFVVISLIAYAMTAERKPSTSSVTNIE
jgi:hypothetical protein